MRTTRPFSITSPHEMADVLKERVRSGEYASEGEVVAIIGIFHGGLTTRRSSAQPGWR